MSKFRFTAVVRAEITVDAPTEALARAQIFSDLQYADTDFIRSDYFDERSICAEFHFDNIEVQP